MVIDLQNVTFSRGGQKILDSVNWQVQRGENWILLGLNGSGKTSLLSIVTGYFFPSKGKVSVLDYTFGEAIISDLRKKIGWISSAVQQDIPPSESPLEIVLSGLFASIGLWEPVTEEQIQLAEQVLEKMGISHLRDRDYATLSQGERQRTIIGRALINDPDILIFDEACNGLDIFAKKDLYDLITQLAQTDKTLIFVTHNTEEILPVFNKALLLKDGQVHSQGLRQDVIVQENLQDFYGTDVDVFEHDSRYYISVK